MTFSDMTVLSCISPYMAENMAWFMPCLAIALGAVFGSYMTCAHYRVPRGESLWHPPSQCPKCHAQLQVPDLVPVLSWAAHKGACRHCKNPVSVRYPLIELLSILVALVAWQVSQGFSFVLLYGFWVATGAFLFFLLKHKMFALKSVAFALLCLGLYVTFQQPLFACGAAIY